MSATKPTETDVTNTGTVSPAEAIPAQAPTAETAPEKLADPTAEPQAVTDADPAPTKSKPSRLAVIEAEFHKILDEALEEARAAETSVLLSLSHEIASARTDFNRAIAWAKSRIF